ncbi:MAG: acetyl-CoA carboxylase biotin carboxyl carrier protein subunit [SAR202 cluster bacterium]|jgi:biotin carboxyl carrier protein|nr:acetyl-CoA carboxylase biotin carboxyl carrier protein subunit [SAR202 cluster bacterium]
MTTTLRVKVGERWYTVEISDPTADPIVALVDGEEVQVHIARADLFAKPEPATVPAPTPIVPAPPPPTPTVQPDPAAAAASSGPIKQFKTPMPGVILSVSVQVGDQVVTGDEICVLEAMKMQQILRADWSGIVTKVHVGAGQQVLDGDPIVDL